MPISNRRLLFSPRECKTDMHLFEKIYEYPFILSPVEGWKRVTARYILVKFLIKLKVEALEQRLWKLLFPSYSVYTLPLFSPEGYFQAEVMLAIMLLCSGIATGCINTAEKTFHISASLHYNFLLPTFFDYVEHIYKRLFLR